LKPRSLLVAAASLAALAVTVWLWSDRKQAHLRAFLGEEPPNFGDSSVAGARPTPPLPELAFAGGGPELSFFALGDTGFGGEILASNALAMERSAESRPVDLVLLLGDNFYLEGVSSLEDPLWRERFEDAFAGAKLQVPFYAVLGNHDYRGDPDVEVAYTQKSARWRMPARWYTFTQALRGGGEVQFFALDTLPLEGGWPEAREEMAWLAKEIAESKARWKIAFAHHPALSHGHHGPTPGLADLIGRTGIDLYVSGHDHDLQIIRSKAGWMQIVSGAGSSTRDTNWEGDTLFAAASPGFAWVGISGTEMWIEISTAAQGPRFRTRVEKR
jgi:tartrate-resistant acid phosphatase type 5